MKRSYWRIVCSGLLMMGLSGGASVWAVTNQTPARAEAVPRIEPATLLAALSAWSEARIGTMADALAVAAQSQQVQSLDWERMQPVLAAVQERFGPANVWFARPDGTYFTVDKGLVEKNLSDRAYFPKVRGGQTVVGELVVSRATGGNSVITAVPIQREGRTLGVLGASIYLEPMIEQLRQRVKLPAGLVFYALDSSGQIALHTQEALIFHEATQLGSPTLTAAVKQMLATPSGQVNYQFEGRPQQAVFLTGRLTGWKYAIRFPAVP